MSAMTRVVVNGNTDMLVRTPEQIAARLAIEDTFMCEILARGKVMIEDFERDRAALKQSRAA